ncbi:2-methylcitrate dehydratase [Nocardioides sp. Root1257]|uniref:MmgE/PrpD family protein n=1 Tax=unclassified Nocardioides TaxID=2615069 RepID=UPI0006FF23E8|nr:MULTISPECIES: MmgE/PrpD family protein [unclassified Nocardioides]KQW53680.1 2-methylcitrate dehydratase [Nocardioides sp. Root1257]KRC56366.1 2-methylcitrate dehydratase [Nocardioides sp. Root224]
MTVASDLAAWALGLRSDELPAEVGVAARRHLLDGIGTAVAAARRGAAESALSVAAGLGGPPEATLLGRGVKVSAPAAALATGTLVHALDFDDTHAGGLVHATAVVLPAVLAVGEEVGATSDEALLAAVVGFETVCRIAGAAPHAFHQRGLHATLACGVFASALVTARLMRLDLATTVNALGIAGSSAGGLLEFLATGSSTKQLHPGLASQAGIIAARLAAAGADGPDSVLEGERGLYAALADGHADPALVTADLGIVWETTRITLKPYPACQLMHAALDAGRQVLPVSSAEIEEIAVEVHPDSAAIVCTPDKVDPRTAYDAKFSLPWSLAALLTDGAVTTDTYEPDSLGRSDVRALAARVRVTEVPDARVAADAPSRVTITLTDGRTLAGHVDRSAGAALDAKLAANVGSAQDAAALTAAVEALDLYALITIADRLAEEHRVH